MKIQTKLETHNHTQFLVWRDNENARLLATVNNKKVGGYLVNTLTIINHSGADCITLFSRLEKAIDEVNKELRKKYGPFELVDTSGLLRP